MVFLRLMFVPAEHWRTPWLDGRERARLNEHYSKNYDAEFGAIRDYAHARSTINERIARFFNAEPSGDRRHRVTVASSTGLHIANDTLVSEQLFGPMAWEQVLKNARGPTKTMVAIVHIIAPISERDRRRAAFMQAALLSSSALHTLAGHTELLKLICLEAVPYATEKK